MNIRIATKTEHLYMYAQSQQLSMQSGLIGHLRADMDSNGEAFLSTWWGFRDSLKTQEFKDEFDSVIASLRTDEAPNFLKNRTALSKFCYSHLDALIEGNSYGVRVDTDNYTYMMRLNPNKGEYNLYCYCYKREWLDRNIKNAEKGIRFIDSNYKTLFTIPDGGKIRITYSDGTVEERTCRYIDEYHTQVGHGWMSDFHICQFAEFMEEKGYKYEPVNGEK